MAAAFNSYDGVSADFVTESTSEIQRKTIVDKFKNGELQVLLNCMVFTEGFDAPATAVVANCRPTKSESLYAQIIGRVTRPLPGVVDGPDTPEARRAAIASSEKPFCTVLDFVGNSGKHKLVSVVDVLAGDRIDPLDLEEALKVATETGETVDIEELAEKIKLAREERQERENDRKARLLVTNTFASAAAYSAVEIDLFAGASFKADNDPEPATRGQCGFLLHQCKMPWWQAQKLSKSEASAKIRAAKANAEKAWIAGIRSAKTVIELQAIGERIGHRKEIDRLINGEATLERLRRAYAGKLNELKKGNQ